MMWSTRSSAGATFQKPSGYELERLQRGIIVHQRMRSLQAGAVIWQPCARVRR